MHMCIHTHIGWIYSLHKKNSQIALMCAHHQLCMKIDSDSLCGSTGPPRICIALGTFHRQGRGGVWGILFLLHIIIMIPPRHKVSPAFVRKKYTAFDTAIQNCCSKYCSWWRNMCVAWGTHGITTEMLWWYCYRNAHMAHMILLQKCFDMPCTT
jgi:hypothetical protein